MTKLEISSTNPKFFDPLVPSSVKILRYSNGNWDPDLLEKQKQLEELSLRGCVIQDFQYDPDNCHIEKLEICFLDFANGRAFEKFSDFMKIQESVTELEFGIYEVNPMNHAGLLTHLLNLKTLKKVTFHCDYEEGTLTILSSLKVCNPAVETLIIVKPPFEANLKSISKFFPNTTDLKATWDYNPSIRIFSMILKWICNRSIQ